MDKLTSYIIALTFLNLTAWSWLNVADVKETKEQLIFQITSVKASNERKETILSWSNKTRKLLSETKIKEASEILEELRNIASSKGFEITQAINKGGVPATINISGNGGYMAFAALLKAIEKNKFTSIDTIDMEKTDEGIIKASLEASIKTNIWSNKRIEGEFPEIKQIKNQYSGIGLRDIFGSYVPPTRPSMHRPRIKYLGYYAGKKKPTIILEEHLRAVLMQLGEKTPNGSTLSEATPDEIKVTDVRGKVWTFKMKK